MNGDSQDEVERAIKMNGDSQDCSALKQRENQVRTGSQREKRWTTLD